MITFLIDLPGFLEAFFRSRYRLGLQILFSSPKTGTVDNWRQTGMVVTQTSDGGYVTSLTPFRELSMGNKEFGKGVACPPI